MGIGVSRRLIAEQIVAMVPPVRCQCRELTRGRAGCRLPEDLVLLKSRRPPFMPGWRNRHRWRRMLQVGNKLLVCDV